MHALLNIPKHNCQNCGLCCGLIPASKDEIETIKKYLKDNPHIFDEMGETKKTTCPFRSEEKKKCLIYPVRPMVCRLFGVDERLVCKYGNSANIDGYKFLDKNFYEQPNLLNLVRWDE